MSIINPNQKMSMANRFIEKEDDSFSTCIVLIINTGELDKQIGLLHNLSTDKRIDVEKLSNFIDDTLSQLSTYLELNNYQVLSIPPTIISALMFYDECYVIEANQLGTIKKIYPLYIDESR